MSEPRRILVTGGSGFVGRALLARLQGLAPSEFLPTAVLRPSSDIVGVERLLDYVSSETNGVPRPRVHIVDDFFDAAQLADAVRDVDIVVHLAADVDFVPADSRKMMRFNIKGTRALLDACAKECETRQRHNMDTSTQRPIRFVYVSSTETLGAVDDILARGATPDENSRLAPDADYGRSKVAAESIVAKYALLPGMECVTLRPTGVYGIGERFFFHEFVTVVESGLLLVAPGNMQGRIMLTHVDDVVSAILLAARSPNAPGNIYNVCPEYSMTYRAIARLMASCLHRAVFAVVAPLGPAKVIVDFLDPVLNRGKRRKFMLVRSPSVHTAFSTTTRSLWYDHMAVTLDACANGLLHSFSAASYARRKEKHCRRQQQCGTTRTQRYGTILGLRPNGKWQRESHVSSVPSCNRADFQSVACLRWSPGYCHWQRWRCCMCALREGLRRCRQPVAVCRAHLAGSARWLDFLLGLFFSFFHVASFLYKCIVHCAAAACRRRSRKPCSPGFPAHEQRGSRQRLAFEKYVRRQARLDVACAPVTGARASATSYKPQGMPPPQGMSVQS